MQIWSTLDQQQGFWHQTVAGLQPQLNVCEAHIKLLIFHQTDPLKDRYVYLKKIYN